MRQDRRAQVLELIKERGSVSLKDVSNALGISKVHAGVLLLDMTEGGELERTGVSRHYRYSLPALEAVSDLAT